MKLFFVIFSIVLSLNVSASDKFDGVVNFSLTKSGEFDVVYHRVDPAGAGAAAGGLIGAAIQTGHQSGKDRDKLEVVRPHITLNSCGDILMASFKEKFEKKSISSKEMISGHKFKKGDLILKIGIDACGFKLTNSVDKLLSSYVLGKVVFTRKGEKTPLLKERLYLTGKKQFSFDELLNDSDQIDLRLEKILSKAGKRIANKIIYL